MLELFGFILHGAAVHQKVLQCPVKGQMNTLAFSSKSTSFLGISNIIMIYKSYSIIVETSLNCFSHSKIMTAVTSQLCLTVLISMMPPGSAKDIVMQMYGKTDRSTSLCSYILYFPFISFLG